MTDIRKMFEKEFIYAYDLEGRDITVEIREVKGGSVKGTGGKATKKPVVFFKGSVKGLALNITNVRIIGGLLGSFQTQDWIGKRITLYPTTTDFGGKTVDCIRVRPKLPAEKAKAEQLKDDVTPPEPEPESTIETQQNLRARSDDDRHHRAAAALAAQLMGKSPLHYLYPQEYSSSAMDKGSAADQLILDPGAANVITYPGATRRGEKWEAFERANQGALIVTKKEFESAMGMAESVRRHPEAMRYLQGTIRETLIYSINGRLCRATPEVRNDKQRFITDLKTGETSDPRRFHWKVRDFCYHGQVAWYRDAATIKGFPRPENCYIVAIEQKAPYVVTVFRLTDHILDIGERLNRLWFEQVRACEQSGEFPGYSASTVDLDLADPDADDITLEDAGGEEDDAAL